MNRWPAGKETHSEPFVRSCPLESLVESNFTPVAHTERELGSHVSLVNNFEVIGRQNVAHSEKHLGLFGQVLPFDCEHEAQINRRMEKAAGRLSC